MLKDVDISVLSNCSLALLEPETGEAVATIKCLSSIIDNLPKSLRHFFDVWSQAHTGKFTAPLKTDLDPTLLARYGLLPFVWIVERNDDGGDYFYRLVGEEVRITYAHGLKDRTLREVFPPDSAERIRSRYDRVIDKNLMEYSNGNVLSPASTLYFGERVLLPLSDEAGINKYVVGCVIKHGWNWRAERIGVTSFAVATLLNSPLACFTRQERLGKPDSLTATAAQKCYIETSRRA